MALFRPGAHVLLSRAGVVNEVGFCDMSEKTIVAKDSSYLHSEHRREGPLHILS